MRLVYRLITVVLTYCCLFANAQTKIAPIGSFLNPIEYTRGQLPIEKLYVQTDKPGYAAGDTIWFKAYLLNADYLTPSKQSGLLYIELDDIGNKCTKRIMVPLVSGVSWGNIALLPDEIPDGTYTLRAYTNWMLNFGEDFIFKQQLSVSSVNNQPRLINAYIKKTKQGPKDSIQAVLLFNDINKEPVRLQDMQLKVVDGKRTLFRYKGVTTLEGKMNLNFALPNQSKNAFIIARETAKKDAQAGADLIIPINANRPENTDLQFMPEGGKLLAGIPAHIGFKALSEDGRGTHVEGKIYNNKQTLVTTFKSNHKGMGVFDFTPQAGETYTAELNLPDGTKKSYPLPPVGISGTSLKVTTKGADSLEVTLSATTDLQHNNRYYYLIGQSRDAPCYGALINFTGAQVKKTIARSVFPSGITRFTLLSAERQPLNERMVFINQGDELHLSMAPHHPVYKLRDSVSLNIKVTDKDGSPVQGFFSLAVTDDNQVKTDSTGNNILTAMLLTSDLKGAVEDPAYYFENRTPQITTDLDNLLLTQGWVGYSWKQIYSPNIQATFAAEPEFIVKGQVTNLFNKPVAKAGVVLLSKNPSMVIDTVTGDDGRFAFKGFSPVDSTSFMIQARTKRGKSFGMGVTVDEPKPPVFMQTSIIPTPWYVNMDTTALRNLGNVDAKRIAQEKALSAGTLLKNVTITGKKIVKNSKNLVGPGEADQILDDKDMEKAGKLTLLQLLEQKITGYHETGLWSPNPFGRPLPYPVYYMIKDRLIRFIFDGVDLIKNFRGTMQEYRDYVKGYLDYYTAEDILGLEVMISGKYTSPYGMEYLDPLAFSSAFAFVEITTRSGHGPYMSKTPGTYLYKPLPLTLPKQFYRPKYVMNNKPTGTDTRSTIHWEPNIVTDANGSATVSFYSADKPGKYTLILQGTDLNGSVGYQRGSVLVK